MMSGIRDLLKPRYLIKAVLGTFVAMFIIKRTPLGMYIGE